jgi:hypothetical protein
MLVFSWGVNDVQLLLELRQGRVGALHLGLQLFELPFHKCGQAGGGTEPDIERVLHIRAGNCIGNIGRKPAVRGTVADEQQVCVGRTRHFEIVEHDRRVDQKTLIGAGRWWAFEFPQMELVGHRAQHAVGLNQLDLRREKLVRVVESRLCRILTDD